MFPAESSATSSGPPQAVLPAAVVMIWAVMPPVNPNARISVWTERECIAMSPSVAASYARVIILPVNGLHLPLRKTMLKVVMHGQEFV
jgi:hypothetical protein